ncbi:MAG: HupE/UreJ family protein [Bacteroidota bacterium]
MKHVHFKQILPLLLLFVPLVGFAHDVTSADQELLRTGGLWAYIQVGATHMLTGYDHLLFLAGVIFYLNGFKDILKFITVFTIGHCITLIGATYAGITANEYLVDAVIALSVFYKGFENLDGFEKLKVKSPNLLLMVGIFGLIHGFGLSTRLQSFDMGSEQILAKILCFNLGVEVGQVLALIPIVFIITLSRKHKQFPAFYKAVNWYLVLAGIFLFAYQMYNYFTGHAH